MIVDFTFDRDEYIVAWRAFLLMRRTVTRLQLVVTVIMFPLIAWLIHREGLTPLLTLMSAAALVSLGMMIRLWFLQPRRIFNKTTRLHQRHWLDFTEERILFRTEGVDSQLGWGNYPRLWENKRFIFLLGDHVWMVLPKRAFSSPEEAESFKNLYRCALPTGTVKIFK